MKEMKIKKRKCLWKLFKQ